MTVPVPKTRLADWDPKNTDATWGKVLSKFVNSQGQIDFQGLAKNSANLEAYVQYISEVNPKKNPARFKNKDSSLAFYIKKTEIKG